MIFLGNDINDDHYNLNNKQESYLNPNCPGKSPTAGYLYFSYFERKYINYYTRIPPIFEYPAVPY